MVAESSSSFCKQFVVFASTHSIRAVLKHHKVPLFLEHKINSSRKIFTEPCLKGDKTGVLFPFFILFSSQQTHVSFSITYSFAQIGKDRKEIFKNNSQGISITLILLKDAPPPTILTSFGNVYQIVNCTIKTEKHTIFPFGESRYSKKNHSS